MSSTLSGFGLFGDIELPLDTKKKLNELAQLVIANYWLHKCFIEHIRKPTESDVYKYEETCQNTIIFINCISDELLHQISDIRINNHRATIKYDSYSRGGSVDNYDQWCISFLQNKIKTRQLPLFLYKAISAYRKIMFNVKIGEEISRDDLISVCQHGLDDDPWQMHTKNTIKAWDSHYSRLIRLLICEGYDIKGEFIFTTQDYEREIKNANAEKQRIFRCWYNLPKSDLPDIMSLSLLQCFT